MHKTWNVRDQTEEALEELLTRKYKEIDSEYKMLRKISNVEDAKKMLDEIWQMKKFCKRNRNGDNEKGVQQWHSIVKR